MTSVLAAIVVVPEATSSCEAPSVSVGLPAAEPRVRLPAVASALIVREPGRSVEAVSRGVVTAVAVARLLVVS